MNEQTPLTFDLPEVVRQLSDVKHSYETLSIAMQSTFEISSDEIKGLIKEVDTLSVSLTNASMSLDTTYANLNERMRESSSILAEIEKYGKGIGSLALDVEGGAAAQVKDIYPGLAGDLENPQSKQIVDAAALAEQAAETAKDAVKTAKDTKAEVKEELSGIGKVVQKELENAKKGIGSTLSSIIPGGMIGKGLIGGIIGSIIMGVAYKQRTQAEAGEMANVFESSVDGLGNKVTQKATTWFSDFQEKAQKLYGIGRKEVQAQVDSFVKMGYETHQFFKTFDKGLGEVGSNIPTLTLALEKHLNLASGSVAKNVNITVAELGDNLDEATGKIFKLAFAAQQSGIGIEKFINTVMSGSQAMRQYGIDVEDVAQVVQGLTGYYENMLGADRKQFAGGLAAEAMGSVASGMGRMGEGYTAAIHRQMNPESDLTGHAAIQDYRSGFRRMVEEDDNDWLIEDIKAKVAFARSQVGGDEVAMSVQLQKEAGWDERHVPALIRVADNLEAGKEISEADAEQLKEFKKTWDTEGLTLTELQKTQNQLVKDMAKVGEGMLGMLTSLLGLIMVGLKSIPMLMDAIVATPGKRVEILKAIEAAVDVQSGHMKTGWDKFTSGIESGAGHLGEGIGGMSKAIDAAWNFKGPDTEAMSVKNVTKALSQKNEQAAVKLVGDLAGKEAGEKFERGLNAVDEKLNNFGDSVYFRLKELSEEISEAKEAFDEKVGRAKGALSESAGVSGPTARMEVRGIIENEHLRSAMNSASAAEVG